MGRKGDNNNRQQQKFLSRFFGAYRVVDDGWLLYSSMRLPETRSSPKLDREEEPHILILKQAQNVFFSNVRNLQEKLTK